MEELKSKLKYLQHKRDLLASMDMSTGNAEIESFIADIDTYINEIENDISTMIDDKVCISELQEKGINIELA